MDFVNVYNFFAFYSPPVLIIAFLLFVIQTVLELFIKKNGLIKNFLPFLIGIVFHLAYNSIFVEKRFSFTEETVSMGIVSATLCVMVKGIINRIKNGNSVDIGDGVRLVIEGLLRDYVNHDLLSVASVAVETVIDEEIFNGNKNEQVIIEKVAKTIKDYSLESVSDCQIKNLASLAVESVKKLKQQ